MERKNLMLESVMYITGRQNKIRMSGKKSKVQAYKKVLDASRKLYEALENPKTRLKQVENLVEAKIKAAEELYEKTGMVWPL